MSRRLALLLSSAILGAAVASPALARQTEETKVDEVVITGSQVRLPPVYSGGQVAAGARVGLLGALDTMDTPFAITSYTEELIRDQQARSIADVLQNDPTVRVSKGFGNFQELYVVRGFPVYSDDMTYNGLYGVLPRQFVAAELVERVDVFRGANAFLNGAAPGGSGVGGAFNLMPKRAGTAPLTRLTTGWDGGSQFYGSADVSRRFGENNAYGARLNLGLRDGETAVDNEKRNLKVVGLGLDRRGDRARFSADLGFQDHHIDAPRPTVTPAGAIPKAPDAGENFAQPWTYTDERQLFGAARGEFDLTDTVSAWAAIGGRKGKEDNVLANPTAQPNGVISAYRFDNVRKDEVISADAGLRGKFQTGSIGHSLVASVASAYYTLWADRWQLALAALRLDEGHGAFGLMLLAVALEHAHRLAVAEGAPQLLLEQLGVGGDHVVGRAQDVTGGAVVLLQRDHLQVGVVLRQLLEVVQRGATPAVNRLVVVTHGREDALWSDQQLQHLVLGGVGVLVLVHQHVLELLLPFQAHMLMLGQ